MTQLASDVGRGVALARGADGRFAPSGELVSRVEPAAFPFDDAILSWNAAAPAGTSLRFALRVQTGDEWSRWYTLGIWGPGAAASVPGQEDTLGRVEVDTLRLRRPARALQYRVQFTTQDPRVSPALGAVAVAYSDLRRPLTGTPPPLAPGWARDLLVPSRSQVREDPAIRYEICSPTSLSMLLAYWGIDRPVGEVARGVFDRAAGIYGNWPLNTAYAGALGLRAYVDRCFAVEQLQNEIAAGRPVITSMRWRAGELDSAPQAAVPSGHLMVVRGFTPAGDVIVNDPLAPDPSTVRRVYKRAQFANVWLRNSGGVVYVVRPA